MLSIRFARDVPFVFVFGDGAVGETRSAPAQVAITRVTSIALVSAVMAAAKHSSVITHAIAPSTAAAETSWSFANLYCGVAETSLLDIHELSIAHQYGVLFYIGRIRHSMSQQESIA